MNEENLSRLSTESFQKLETALNNPEADGVEVLAAFLSMEDEDFEILRPLFQDILKEAYDNPQVKFQLVQALNESGVSAEDLINNADEIAKVILQTDDPNLSDSKKDFLQYIFTTATNALSDSTLNPGRYIEIPVELCREDAKLPSYATNGAGAMDIYSPIDIELDPGECKIIPIGIKVNIPHGYGLLIQPRSGLSSRIKLRIPNTPGLIDEDYHEEIGVIVENIDPKIKEVGLELKDGELLDGTLFGSNITISKGERFAQMRLVEIPRVRWRQVASIGDYDNDHGAGFGSTGVK